MTGRKIRTPQSPHEPGFRFGPRTIGVGRAQVYVGLIGVAVGIVLAAAALWRSEIIAQQSGAHDRPSLEVSLAHCAFSTGDALPIFVGAPFDPKTIYMLELPLGIRNRGPKTLRRGEITIRYPTLGRIAIPPDMLEVTASGSVPEKLPTRRHSVLGNYDYVSYTIPDIDPGVSFLLHEPIVLNQTSVIGSLTEGTTNWQYQLDYGYQVLVTAGGEDVRSVDFRVDLAGVKASSLEDLKGVFKRRIQQQARETRASLSVAKYVALMISRSARSAVLVWPTPSEPQIFKSTSIVKADSGRVEVSCASYDDVSWKYLFSAP